MGWNRMKCNKCGAEMEKTLADTFFCYSCKKEVHDFEVEE